MWFSSGSVVGWGVWWFVGRLSFEICPDTFMLPVLLIQIWIISGQWLNLVSFFFFFLYKMHMLHCCRQMCFLFGRIYCWPIHIYIFYVFLHSMFLQHFFFFFVFLLLTIIQYTHKDTFSLSEADNQSGSPLGFLQTFDRFYTTRILRHLCKSLSFNDFLCLCPVGGGLCLVSVMVIAGRVKSIW